MCRGRGVTFRDVRKEFLNQVPLRKRVCVSPSVLGAPRARAKSLGLSYFITSLTSSLHLDQGRSKMSPRETGETLGGSSTPGVATQNAELRKLGFQTPLLRRALFSAFVTALEKDGRQRFNFQGHEGPRALQGGSEVQRSCTGTQCFSVAERGALPPNTNAT